MNAKKRHPWKGASNFLRFPYFEVNMVFSESVALSILW